MPTFNSNNQITITLLMKNKRRQQKRLEILQKKNYKIVDLIVLKKLMLSLRLKAITDGLA